MSFTPTLILPLSSTADAIYTNLWDKFDDGNNTHPSTQSAFETGINERDNKACILRGLCDFRALEHCQIIESYTWELMRKHGYVPAHAKSAGHESRNGILLCKTHRSGFDHYVFYIRWIEETNQFVIVNHSREPDYEALHGKLLHFNTKTKHCPFPTAFLWHECRVRGFYPTCGDREVTIQPGSGVLGIGNDRGSALDIHTSGELSSHNSGIDASASADNGVTTSSSGHDSDDMISFTPAPLAGDNLVSWLAAARRHSSWKDCVVENMSWDGTAADNIEKYQREVGVEKGL